MADINESMINENDKEWTIAYCEQVIAGHVFSSELDEAIAFLKANKPDSEYLRSLLYDKDGSERSINDIKALQASEFLQSAVTRGVGGPADFNEAIRVVKAADSDTFRDWADEFRAKYIDDIMKSYESDENIDETVTENTVENNVKYIGKVLDNVFDDDDLKASDEIVALSNIAVVDENDVEVLSEDRDRVIDAFVETAKQATVLDLAHETTYNTLNQDERDELIKHTFKENIGKRLLLSVASENVGRRRKDESAATYLRRYNEELKRLRDEDYLEKMRKAVNQEHIVIKKPTVAMHSAMTEEALRQRKGYYDYMGKSKLSNLFNKLALSYHRRMHQFLGDAHDFAVMSWRNKVQIATMGIASLAAFSFAGAVSVPTAVGIGIAYGAFSKAASWAFPLWNRRNAMLKSAPKGVDTSHLKGLKNLYGLWEARNSMSEKERAEFKDSQNKAWLMSGISAGGLILGAGLVNSGLFSSAKLAMAGSSVVRLGSINVVNNYWINKTKDAIEKLKAQSAKNPQDEKLVQEVERMEKSLRMQQFGRNLTNVAAVAIGTLQTLNAEGAENVGNHSSGNTGETNTPADTTHVDKQPVQEPVAQPEVSQPEVDQSQQYWENYEVPEMNGDALSSWAIMNKIGAVLPDSVKAQIAARLDMPVEDLDGQAIYEEWTKNFATFFHNNPEVAEELNIRMDADGNPNPNDVVRFENNVITRLVFSAKAEHIGKGTLLATTDDGMFKFGDSSFEAPMNFFMKIACNGYNLKVPEGVDFNHPFENLDRDLANGTNNHYLREVDCGKVVYAVKHGGGHHPVTPPAQEVVPPAKEVVPPAPEQPETTTIVTKETPVKQPELSSGVVEKNATEVTDGTPDHVVASASIKGTGNNFTDVGDGKAHGEVTNRIYQVVEKEDGTRVPLSEYMKQGQGR